MSKAKKRVVDILSRLESKKGVDYGKIHIMDGSTIEQIPRISTGLLSLDLASGGGYPHGRIIEVSGAESSGKTTLTLHAIAAAQKAGGVCAFIDAEYALDLAYAAKLGVDVPNMLLSQPDHGEQALDVAVGLATQMQGGDIIVIDSIAAIKPKVLMAETLADMGAAPGLHARMMSTGLPPLNQAAAKSGVLIYCTNQLRALIGMSYGPTKSTTGGNALKFYASQRFDVKKKAQIKVGEHVIGTEVEITVTKNKVAPPFRKALTANIFGEGMAAHVDILQTALRVGIVKKAGSWLSYEGVQLGQGFLKAAEALKEDAASLDLIREHVLSLHKGTHV